MYTTDAVVTLPHAGLRLGAPAVCISKQPSDDCLRRWLLVRPEPARELLRCRRRQRRRLSVLGGHQLPAVVRPAEAIVEGTLLLLLLQR